jgi:hypothetical protein
LVEFCEFGVDRTEAGVGPLMVGIPSPAPVELWTKFLDGLFTTGEFPFGVPDVVGEGVDLVGGGGLSLRP